MHKSAVVPNLVIALVFKLHKTTYTFAILSHVSVNENITH